MKKLVMFLALSATCAYASAPVTAWTKLVQLPDTGAYANYWVESFLHYDIQQGQVILQVDGYVSKAVYQAGKAPIVTKHYTLPDNVNPALRDGGKAFLSGYVLSQPEFAGAKADQ